MKKKWLQLLADNNLQRDNCSKAIKSNIKKYEIVEAGHTAASEELTELDESDPESEEKITEIKAEIVDFEKKLNDLDDNICRLIALNVKNAPAYDKLKNNLKGNKGKAAAKASSNEPPANDSPANEPPANDPPANEPPANDPPANEPPANDPPANDPPADPTEKKTNPWKVIGIVAGLAAAGALTAIGIKKARQ